MIQRPLSTFSETEALGELVRRGLIRPNPAPVRTPDGNSDRRRDQARSHWAAMGTDGILMRVTLGPELEDLSKRHTALANALDGLIPSHCFYAKLSAADAIGEAFVFGVSIETALNSATLARERIRDSVIRVASALAATERPSTEDARVAEWKTHSKQIAALSVWSHAEREILIGQVFPRLYPILASQAPSTRWTNGDLITANILIEQERDVVHLVDPEFATRTHFFGEDAARFHTFSPAARHQPSLFSDAFPPPGPAWQLFLWLRQMVLEESHNSADYLTQVRSNRLAVIGRLAKQILDCELQGWSVAPLSVHFHLETAGWTQSLDAEIHLGGWCYIPSAPEIRSVVVTANERRLLEVPPARRPDVASHFGGNTRALYSGFDIRCRIDSANEHLTLSAITGDGILLPFYSVQPASLPGRGPILGDYARWAACFDPDPPAPLIPLVRGPRFSILLPVFNTPQHFLRACIRSVCEQHYPYWELCIIDDDSSAPQVADIIEEFAKVDRRVRWQRRSTNGGISRATNDALAAATGDFVVMLDHDDMLRPHALKEIASALSADLSLDAIYSDEDKISADGDRMLPLFKPDFAPEFLRGVMYVGHVLAVRTSEARAVGGFDPAFDGIQDFEFMLRITERTRRIGHVPRILYHWRRTTGSSALHGNIKGDMDRKQVEAVQAHLVRQGDRRIARALGGHRVRLEATTTLAIEIVRWDDSIAPWAALKAATAKSIADILLLIGDQLGVQTPTPTEQQELAALATLPDSGLVSPVSLSPDGRVFAAGWTEGPHGLVPLMQGFDASGDGYHGSLKCNREVSFVSPFCVAIRRELVRTYEHDAAASWESLCIGLLRAGFLHRINAAVHLRIAPTFHPWPIGADRAPTAEPYYNPHFDAARGDYRLAQPPAYRPAYSTQ